MILSQWDHVHSGEVGYLVWLDSGVIRWDTASAFEVISAKYPDLIWNFRFDLPQKHSFRRGDFVMFPSRSWDRHLLWVSDVVGIEMIGYLIKPGGDVSVYATMMYPLTALPKIPFDIRSLKMTVTEEALAFVMGARAAGVDLDFEVETDDDKKSLADLREEWRLIYHKRGLSPRQISGLIESETREYRRLLSDMPERVQYLRSLALDAIDTVLDVTIEPDEEPVEPKRTVKKKPTNVPAKKPAVVTDEDLKDDREYQLGDVIRVEGKSWLGHYAIIDTIESNWLEVRYWRENGATIYTGRIRPNRVLEVVEGVEIPV